jgi:hypothetical protein
VMKRGTATVSAGELRDAIRKNGSGAQSPKPRAQSPDRKTRKRG